MTTSKAPLLVGIGYSPWTLKARWALEHRRKAYRYREHLVMLGMPELRLRTGRWTGDVTVPALVAPGHVLTESWDIALWADEGSGDLFPSQEIERLRAYNVESDRLLDQVRARVSSRVLSDPEAKAEAVSAAIPRGPWQMPLARAGAGIATMGIAYLQKGFGFEVGPEVERRAFDELRTSWARLARELSAAGGDFLVGGRRTYADYAMAATLQALDPVLPADVGPAQRRAWTTPELHAEFAALLRWRERVIPRR